jgi:hypothetical protein
VAGEDTCHGKKRYLPGWCLTNRKKKERFKTYPYNESEYQIHQIHFHKKKLTRIYNLRDPYKATSVIATDCYAYNQSSDEPLNE